jgi:tetratricopeptide (TPR) repeat protein
MATDDLKQPSSLSPKIRRRLIILLAAVAVLAVVAYGAWKHFTTRDTDVYFVNGLDLTLLVRLGDRTVKVPPQEVRRERNVARGQYSVVAATETGRIVDEFNVVLPRRTDVVVVNPLGAAPLFAEQLVYYRDGVLPTDAAKDEAPRLIHYYSLRFVTRENVAYAFRPPSPQRHMPANALRQTVWQFGLEPGGWRASVYQLLNRNRPKEAAQIARNVAEADPNAEEAISTAAGLLAQVSGQPAAVEWLQSLTQKFPDSVEVHRHLQTYLQLAGHADQCRQLYRQLHEQNPASAMYGYLRARVEPPAESLKLFAALTEKFPQYSYMRRSYGWQLFQARRFADAIVQFEKSLALDPSRHADVLFNHLRALAAIGRAADAADLLMRYTDEQKAPMPFAATVFYARLLRLAGQTRPARPIESLLQREFGETIPRDVLVWLECLLGDSEPSAEHLADLGTTSPLRAAADITLAVRRDPELALRLAAGAPPAAWNHMEDIAGLLLASELGSRGDKEQAAQLLGKLRRSLAEDVALKKFILDNEESPELAERDLDTQAVLNFTRGRRAQSRGEPSDGFFQAAANDDILQTYIPHVIKNWRPLKIKE